MKLLIYIGITIGGAIGGYLPSLIFHNNNLFVIIITSGLGSLLGLWVGYKFVQYLEI